MNFRGSVECPNEQRILEGTRRAALRIFLVVYCRSCVDCSAIYDAKLDTICKYVYIYLGALFSLA